MDLVYSYTAFFVAYLIGSISFAVIVSKLMGLGDPRTYGSKNPGATNVLRSGSKVAAVLTLLLDALKGYLPTALVQHYAFELGFEDTTIAFVGVAAFIGHLFPVFFGFKGGKGVATAAGVLWALDWRVGLGLTAIWALVFAVTRVSSLSALIGSAAAPVLGYVFFGNGAVFYATLVMAALLFWRHKENIRRLASGEEAAFKKR